MGIPILLYHEVFGNAFKGEKYAIAVEEFERQMGYLSENGFKSLPLGDFVKGDSGSDNSKREIIITFDDGNVSDYTIALPVLKHYGLSAAFFVTTKRISTEDYVEWLHLKEMIANGMSIQSHGLTHSFLSELDRINLYKELFESKSELQSKLNVPVDFISLPGGFCSKFVLKMAEEVGYRGICNSVPGLNKVSENTRRLMVLNRFVITKRIDFRKFKAIVNGDWSYITACKAENYFKAGIKKVLGAQRYYWIWSKYFKK
jgi:peptidoglycan/xylan/chitin deacetylase (PgdA/CDA1 family)